MTIIAITLSKSEKKTIEDKAKKENLSTSSYIRYNILK